MFLRVGEDDSVTQRRKTKKSSSAKAKRKPKGIVYILKMYLGDKDDMQCVYKVGVTSRGVRPLETRISEICTSHFVHYRYFPYVEPRKFSKTPYYYEVKGWMDARSKTKLKRMAKYHPEVRVIVFGKKEYTDLRRKLSKLIPNWE